MRGHITPAMADVLQPHVSGKHVHDLGACDLRLSMALVTVGAEKVTAVDRNPMPTLEAYPEIEPHQSHFDDFIGSPRIAFVSWPVNWPCGIPRLIRNAEKVIYLGKNTDGLCCADPQFWDMVTRREVLDHVPNEANTLIVYGKESGRRSLLPEEMAAVYTEKMWSFAEATAAC